MRQIIFSFVLFGAACASTPPSSGAPAPSLVDTSWSVTQLNGAAPAPSAHQQTLAFNANGQVNGNGGCNGFGGGFTQSGGSLRFSQLIHTMMACAPGMEAEGAYMAALDATRSASVTGETLTLNDSGGRAVARLSRVREGS